jgi:L-lactate dehydrogenase (cytochrome)
MRDRGFVKRLIDRATVAGCTALVLTMDLQISGQRHKDVTNGLSAPPGLTMCNLINMRSKPRWRIGILGAKRRTFSNIVGHVKGAENMTSLAEWSSQQFDPALSWDDVAWVRKRRGGKLILNSNGYPGC